MREFCWRGFLGLLIAGACVMPQPARARTKFEKLGHECQTGNKQSCAKLAEIATGNKHPRQRRLATQQVTEQSMLAGIAKSDKVPSVREAAVARLTDQALLAEIARHDADSGVRRAAVSRVSDQSVLIEVAMKDPDRKVREAATEKVTDQAVLSKIANNSKLSSEERSKAIDRLTDQSALAEIAQGDSDAALRKEAVLRLNKQAVLTQIARHDKNKFVHWAALKKLKDQKVAAEIRKAWRATHPEKVPFTARINLQRVFSSPDSPPVPGLPSEGTTYTAKAGTQFAVVHFILSNETDTVQEVRSQRIHLLGPDGKTLHATAVGFGAGNRATLGAFTGWGLMNSGVMGSGLFYYKENFGGSNPGVTWEIKPLGAFSGTLVFVVPANVPEIHYQFSSKGKLSPAPQKREAQRRLVTKEASLGQAFPGLVGKDVAVSRTSERMAYEAKAGGQWFVVEDGRQGKGFDGIGRDALLFSPDSKHLAYEAKADGQWLVVVDGHASKAYDLIGIGSLTFSPDSKHLAYEAKRGERWFVVMDGVEGEAYNGFVRGGKLVWNNSSSLHGLAIQGNKFLRVDVSLPPPRPPAKAAKAVEAKERQEPLPGKVVQGMRRLEAGQVEQLAKDVQAAISPFTLKDLTSLLSSPSRNPSKTQFQNQVRTMTKVRPDGSTVTVKAFNLPNSPSIGVWLKKGQVSLGAAWQGKIGDIQIRLSSPTNDAKPIGFSRITLLKDGNEYAYRRGAQGWTFAIRREEAKNQ